MVTVAQCCLVLDLRPGCIVIGSVSAFFNLVFCIVNFVSASQVPGPAIAGFFNVIMLIFR